MKSLQPPLPAHHGLGQQRILHPLVWVAGVRQFVGGILFHAHGCSSCPWQSQASIIKMCPHFLFWEWRAYFMFRNDLMFHLWHFRIILKDFYLIPESERKGENNQFVMPLPFPVPLSEGGLFAEHVGRNNNYLLEGCIETLNYKAWFTVLEGDDGSTCRFDLLYRRWTRGGIFLEFSLSSVAPNHSKLVRVFSWVRSLEMKMP